MATTSKTKTTPKPAAKTPTAKRAAKEPATAKKPATTKTPATTKKPATAKKPGSASGYGPRADFGKPVEGWFAKQPAALQPIVTALRAIVEKAVPRATATLKWGMPVYEVDGGMVCAIGGHKAHVNLILSGPASAFADPDGQLEGDGKTGRRLVLRPGDEVAAARVKGWVEAAAKNRG